MNTIAIILIIVAFLVGVVIAWLFLKKGGNNVAELHSELEKWAKECDNLQQKLVALESDNSKLTKSVEIQQLEAESKLKDTEESLKKKYEHLLAEIKEENTKLDSALKLATEGKIDESIKAQLVNAERSSKKVIELESKLSELKDLHSVLLAEHEPMKSELDDAKAKCESLNKKIVKLEDDLDSAEEEQESLERKLKNKNQELQDSQDALDESTRENRQLKTDLEERESELADSLKKLKNKSDSIEFVQSILTAKQADDSDIKSLDKEVSVIEAFCKSQMMDCLTFLYETYGANLFPEIKNSQEFTKRKEESLQELKEWATVKRKSWLDKKTTIAFVGEFSAGKTSIVNRILSQDNPNIPLLPVSAKATTAIPTYIADGPKVGYRFVSPDGVLKTIPESTFKKVSKEVLDEIKGVSSLIKYFVMTYDNKHLKGLSILDTPGFNSNDKEDKDRTIDVINECDALFWVFDVNAGTVNRSSISLIQKELRKPLIVVINKVDTKPSSEVDKVESLIRKTLTDAGIKVEKYVRFSSNSSLSEIMEPIKSIPHDASRDAYIQSGIDELKQLHDLFIDSVKNAEKEYNNSIGITDKVTDEFIAGSNALWDACNEAAGIPHWETHMFSSDRYEMSEREGNRLMDLLNEIATTRSHNLAEIYDKGREAMAQQQQAYSDFIDVKAAFMKVDACYEEFNRITRNIK